MNLETSLNSIIDSYIFKIPEKSNNSDIHVVVIDNNNFLDVKDEYNMNVCYFNKIKINNDTYNKYINDGLIDNHRYKLQLEHVSLWQSHLHIWKEMIQNNVDKLLILEDTCIFTSDFSESYNKILTQSKLLKYDLLYIALRPTSVFRVLKHDLHLI